jgi:hypothetical protein
VRTSQAIRARRAERKESELRREADAVNRDLRRTVSLLELQHAEDLFTACNPVGGVSHLSAMLRRGSFDNPFAASLTDVDAITLQPHGSILAGGDFQFGSGTNGPFIARFNGDGSCFRFGSCHCESKIFPPRQVTFPRSIFRQFAVGDNVASVMGIGPALATDGLTPGSRLPGLQSG